MPEWIKPTRRELALEVLVILVIPAWNAVAAVVDGRATHVAILTTLGALALVLLIIAIWEWVRSPYRRRRLSDGDLEEAIERWLRRAGYGLTEQTSVDGYTFTIGAIFGGLTTFIMKDESRDSLLIASTRIDSGASIRGALGDADWYEMLYDMSLEIGRFGALLQLTYEPLQTVVYDTVTVDEDLGERDVIDKVAFVRRADAMVNLIAGKQSISAWLDQSSAAPTAEQVMAADSDQALRDLLDRIANSSTAQEPDSHLNQR